MKLLMLIGSLREGGAEGQLILLARELRRRGHSVAVMLLHHEGVRLQDAKAAGLEIIPIDLPRFRPRWSPLPWFRLIGAWQRTIRAIREFRPDVLHAWLFWAHLWSWLTVPFARYQVPLMTSRLETPVNAGFGRVRLFLEGCINRRSDGVWANSEGVAQVVRQLERPAPANMVVIRNGVDFGALDAAAPCDLRREFPEFAPCSHIALIVASLLPVKRHDLLLRAWKLVLAELPDAGLLCVGADGGEGARLEQLRSELGLSARVHFAGPRRDVPSLVKGADLGILCSDREGLSNAMLEYMAAGIGCLCTDVNGAREAIIPGRTGLIVPTDDAGALAAGIITLLKDAALRQRLGQAAANDVRGRFSLTKMADEYENLCRQMTGESETLGRVRS